MRRRRVEADGEAGAAGGDAGPARNFYLVETGFLKLLQVTEEGAELIVRFVGPGEPFGGVVALGDAPYPVTGLVVEPSELRAWTRERLVDLVVRFPQIRTNIMREMTAHMTDALTRVRELATERVGSDWHTRCCASPASAGARRRKACSSPTR